MQRAVAAAHHPLRIDRDPELLQGPRVAGGVTDGGTEAEPARLRQPRRLASADVEGDPDRPVAPGEPVLDADPPRCAGRADEPFRELQLGDGRVLIGFSRARLLYTFRCVQETA